MKLTINKFLFGFIFVLGVVLISTSFVNAKMQEVVPIDDTAGGGGGITPAVPCIGADCWGATVTHFGQTQISNDWSDKLIFVVNMSKPVYAPGEPVVILVGVEYPTCGNRTSNIIVEGQASETPNHYTVINENVKGGYAIYGAGIFTPPFQASSAIGDHSINLKAYVKRDGWFYDTNIYGALASPTPVVVMEMNVPYKVAEPVVIVKPTPTVKIYSDKEIINSGDQVNVFWKSTDATHCNCTYGPNDTDCGYGIGDRVDASNNPYTLAESKTFTVTCDDNVASGTNPRYFKLKHCSSPAEFETGPFPPGTYSTGDVLAGALDNGQYDYRVVDASENSFGLRNIMTTRTPGNVCRN